MGHCPSRESRPLIGDDALMQPPPSPPLQQQQLQQLHQQPQVQPHPDEVYSNSAQEEAEAEAEAVQLAPEAVRDLIARGLRPDLALLPFQMPRMQTDGMPPPPIEENTTRVKNEVNLVKKTLRVVSGPANGQLRVAFEYDAQTAATVSIYFLVEEVPLRGREAFRLESCSSRAPARAVYDIGPGMNQTFVQPESDGLLTAGLSPSDLAYIPHGYRFPMVVAFERAPLNPSVDDMKARHVRSQFNFASLVRQSDGGYVVKVIKQKIEVDDRFYEVQEIYGLEHSESQGQNTDCVVCMCSPRTTAVLPCRHMCLCYSCAQILRTQTNKCPICRSGVFKLLRIKVDDEDSSPAL